MENSLAACSLFSAAPLPVQAVETVPWTWGINTAQDQQVRDLALRHDCPEAEAKP